MMRIEISPPSRIPPALFLLSSLLDVQTAQAPLFRELLPLCWIFVASHEKLDFSLSTPNIKILHH